MKLLLYCTKAKPMLRKLDNYFLDKHNDNYYWGKGQTVPYNLNSKIVAECDYEVEKIYYSPLFCNYTTWSLGKDDLLNKSCLTYDELKNYLGTKDVVGNDGYNGYAIHIKNLHIFDEPKELNISKAPQNMMKYLDENDNLYILISIQPQWLCKILNKEKTIEIRKKVLKEMIK